MYIKVRVIVNSKKEEIIEDPKKKDHFRVYIKQKAERNMANDRILEIFRARFSTQKVKIVNGHHSPSKILSVDSDIL